jgi:hypothetical protein
VPRNETPYIYQNQKNLEKPHAETPAMKMTSHPFRGLAVPGGEKVTLADPHPPYVLG